MSERKSVTLHDFLTDKQVLAAWQIYKDLSPAPGVAAKIATEVIEPNMREIEAKLGQECDAYYLGYMCEYVFMKAPSGTDPNLN